MALTFVFRIGIDICQMSAGPMNQLSFYSGISNALRYTLIHFPILCVIKQIINRAEKKEFAQQL